MIQHWRSRSATRSAHHLAERRQPTKVVLGKALMKPEVVFLDEPTRGIDVGAKTDVYHLIGKMAQQGLAVMFSSSELDEVMALADRILVMADGRITADLPRHAVTREKLIAASTPQD
jgi:erythritol transport system ATP-binding protein